MMVNTLHTLAQHSMSLLPLAFAALSALTGFIVLIERRSGRRRLAHVRPSR